MQESKLLKKLSSKDERINHLTNLGEDQHQAIQNILKKHIHSVEFAEIINPLKNFNGITLNRKGIYCVGICGSEDSEEDHSLIYFNDLIDSRDDIWVNSRKGIHTEYLHNIVHYEPFKKVKCFLR